MDPRHILPHVLRRVLQLSEPGLRVLRDRAKSDPRRLGDLVEIGKVAGQVGKGNIKSSETIMAATED